MMTAERFQRIAARYPELRVAVVGDFSLDRYLEIDPARQDVSLETGLPVHNVVRVRAQAGSAGTIVNNLSALGVGEIHVVGYHGDDGEGYELRRALRALPGVQVDALLETPRRRTFTYCKPLIMVPGREPQELSRLDSKDWTPTPEALEAALIRNIAEVASRTDVMILLDQVEVPNTGVVTPAILEAVALLSRSLPRWEIFADSRRGLAGFPPVSFKMNRKELSAMTGGGDARGVDEVKPLAAELARRNGRRVIVTLAEDGIVGAEPDGKVAFSPTLPVRGPIDIVGAGDCVMANLVTAFAAGAALDEALRIANVAASIVVHQLGTTGTASVAQITDLVGESAAQS